MMRQFFILSRGRWWLPVLFVLTVGAGRPPPSAEVPAGANYAARPEVQAYIQDLSAEHGLEKARLLNLFAGVKRQQRAVELLARPAEKQLLWHQYRAIFLGSSRIQGGVKFWRQHRQTLQRAQEKFGTPPEIVTAILGVETRYGANIGSFPALDSLVTLAFDTTRRTTFFRKELTEYLLLAREQGFDPRSRSSSYAGAMGYGQFIPSSYRNYAVDFDGDGIADLQNSPTDAIGSVANYLASHGWRKDGGIAVRAETLPDFDAAAAGSNPRLQYTVAGLASRGYRAAGLAQQERVAVLRLDGKAGPEYWLGQHNFYVITRYNHSHMYAMAVFHLSLALAAAAASAGEPP